MRSQFSEKVDKYILSPALNNLVEEAKSYLLNLKDSKDIDKVFNLADMNMPEFITINRSVYIFDDSVKYHNDNNTELSLLKFTPDLSSDQIAEYKQFLNDYYHHRKIKTMWMLSNQIINIATVGPLGLSGPTSYNFQAFTYRTIGCKLYNIVSGLNSYYLDDKIGDLLELEPLLDDSKLDGNATVTPITLDQIIKEVDKIHYDLAEGSYYQQSSDDDDVFLEVEPFIDGIDTPYLVEILLNLIKVNTVVGGNFNGKARENIELALNKANEYMQSLSLNTKLTEIEILGQNIKKLLDIHDSIPADTVGDRFSNEKVNMYKDVDPDKLFEDIVNFSKLTAKKFKEIYDNNSANKYSYFGGGDAVKECIIECKSGVDPNLFSTMYSNVNKLGLASYMAD